MVVNFFEERSKCTPEKILATPMGKGKGNGQVEEQRAQLDDHSPDAFPSPSHPSLPLSPFHPPFSPVSFPFPPNYATIPTREDSAELIGRQGSICAVNQWGVGEG